MDSLDSLDVATLLKFTLYINNTCKINGKQLGMSTLPGFRACDGVQHRVTAIIGEFQGSTTRWLDDSTRRHFRRKQQVYLLRPLILTVNIYLKDPPNTGSKSFKVWSVPVMTMMLLSFYWLVDGDIFVAPHKVGCISCMHFLCITMRASDTRFLSSTRFLRASWQSRSEPSSIKAFKDRCVFDLVFDLFNYSLVFLWQKRLNGIDILPYVPAKSDRLDRQNQ